jgi:hypothetical protein
MSDRTILNPANANSLNGVFNGTTPINVKSLVIGNTSNITATTTGGGISLQFGTGPLECGAVDCGDATIAGSITLGATAPTTELEAVSGGLSIANGNGALACGAITAIGNVTTQGVITMGPPSQPTVLTSITGGLSINTGNGSLECGGITSKGGAVFPGTITLGLPGVSGVLSCNSGGQLLWNGTVLA